MKNLTAVHRGLRRLRGFRTTVRLGSAGSVLVSIVLWALGVAFLLDYWIRMGRLERGILLVAVVATAAWAVTRYLLPALRVHEDDVSLALLVERQQGLSSDLVAALQFADGGRRQFGSPLLREAVVDCTAEASGGLDFLEGFSREQLTRRAGVLALTALLIVGPAILMPGHTAAFCKRLFLLSRTHYPTRTRIEEIVSPAGRKAAYGQPVVFRVRAGGELPDGGRVELRALASDLTTSVDLEPDANDPAVYTGKLNRVLDDLAYTVYLGDAYTEPMTLELIPLPLVRVELDPTPPAYAAERFENARAEGRQVLVPEGSDVRVLVSADKQLSGGTVSVDETSRTLTRRGDRLVLDPAGTPFEKVAESMRFRVQVTDADGLSLDRPITGVVQVSPDNPPRVAAAAVSKYVLPTATPMVMYKAIDDYGLSRIILHRTVRHADANETHHETIIARPKDTPAKFAQWHELKLAPLGLAKGDRVTITLEAVDFRGDLPGRSGRSDPIRFQVTDRQGLMEAMRKVDDRLLEKLDDIIEAHLGIGD